MGLGQVKGGDWKFFEWKFFEQNFQRTSNFLKKNGEKRNKALDNELKF